MSSPVWILALIVVVIITFAVGSGTNDAARAAVFVFFPAAAALYFAPSIVAATRKRANLTSIVLLNIFLGWTLVGWVVALVWAYSTPTPAMVAPSPEPPSVTPTLRRCPHCAEDIRAEANVCRYCGRDVEPA